MIERMNFKQQIFTLIDFEPKKPVVFLDFGLKVNVNAGQNKFEVHISTNFYTFLFLLIKTKFIAQFLFL